MTTPRWDDYGDERRAFVRRVIAHISNYQCDLCGAVHKKIALDHDHGTGIIRGLLCPSCNMGLGFLGDDLRGMEAAMRYLRKGPSVELMRVLNAIPPYDAQNACSERVLRTIRERLEEAEMKAIRPWKLLRT